jgi:CBS domain-containing protein
MNVREVMSTEIITVEASTTVAEAATLMGKRQAGSALVMDGDRLEGIFTERDVLRALAADFDSGHHPVSHWMTKDPATIGPDVPAEHALDLMLEGGFRHFPVTEGPAVIGVVSIRDLVRPSG